MKKKNSGKIVDGKYVKMVDTSRAVLWKTRELSLPPIEFTKMMANRVSQLVFRDLKRKEDWIFDYNDVICNRVLKTEGQEAQYYFPIDLASKKKYGR